MKPGLVVSCTAFAAGILAGAWAHRSQAAPVPEREARPAVSSAAPVASPELASARARLAELHAKGASAQPAAVAPPTAAELRARFDKLVAANDGEGLLFLIRDCQAAGECGYPLALEIAVLIEHDTDRKGPHVLGLQFRHENRLQWGGVYPASAWALAHPEGLSPDMLKYAVWTAGRRAESKGLEALRLLMGFAESPLAGENRNQAAQFLYAAPKELDPELEAFIRRHTDDPAMTDPLLSTLTWHQDPGIDTLLEELARIPRDDTAAIHLLDSMGQRASDRTVALLNEFTSDPRPAVQEEARFQLIRARPPVPGDLIEHCEPDGRAYAAGLRRGDIVVSWNGIEFETDDDYWKARKTTAVNGPDPFPIVVVRDGKRVPLSLTWAEFHAKSGGNFTREAK